MGLSEHHPSIRQALERGLILPAAVRGVAMPTAPEADWTEKEFQAAVVKLARRHGWIEYHTHDSRRSREGFPDLVLIRPPRLVVAELKVGANKTTAEQDEWLNLFRACGVPAFVWRPADWSAVVATLTEAAA